MTDPNTSQRGELPPGTRIGDLSLIRPVGRGAQGAVYEAIQVSLGRRVAVKLLAWAGGETEVDEQLERFRREAEAAGRLQHPNIVAIHGLMDWEGRTLIIQEFMAGNSLADLLQQRRERSVPIDEDHCRWAADIMRQLARALQSAHDNGVIHRDIKPDNVLLDEQGTPKIADFGLAKLKDKAGLSMSGAILGTPYYMSPEQVRGDSSKIDHRSDIYGLGATLYRMLTYKPPMKSRSIDAVFHDILHREPPSPRSLAHTIPKDLEAVCLKALEKDPDKRYASAGELADDLDRYLADESTIARPVSRLGRVARSAARLPTSALLALAVLVPVAWVALDLLLRPLGSDPGATAVHGLRLALAGVAAALLCAPLVMLAGRFARHSRLWPALAVLLALGLGGLAAWSIVEQRAAQRHLAAREALALSLELGGTTRRDVNDIEEYIAAWGPRFEEDDAILVARGYLKRGRASRAEGWARRVAADSDRAPVFDVLLSAVFEATGRAHDEGGRAAWDALPDELPWSDWKQVGDVLSDMGHPSQARLAYERAGRRPGADRDLINLELAQALFSLCRLDEADDLLGDVLRWRPDDPMANELAFQIARNRFDVAGSERHLETLASNPRTPLLTRVTLTQAWLKDQQRYDEARQQLESALETWADDPAIVAFCASTIARDAKRAQQLSSRAAGAGDAEQAAALSSVALDDFRRARELFERLDDLESDRVGTYIGLSGVAYELRLYEPERAGEYLDEAVAFAERAIALDPEMWEAHYNLALAELRRALREHGGELPVEERRRFVERLATGLRCNALQPLMLNNAAYMQGELAAVVDDQALLDEALGYARSAVRLATPDPESRCPLELADRSRLSSALDTLRKLQEQDGDLPAALASAEQALSVLDPGDAKLAERRGDVERLRDLVEGE